MPEYRAYLIDDEGHIKASTLVSATGDAGAMDRARRLTDDHDVEVWDRDRRIGTLKRDRPSD